MPAGAVLGLRPQDQVGEGEVGQELPVRDQRVQPLDIGFTEAGVAPSQVIQRGHSIIIASGAQIIPRRAVRDRLFSLELLQQTAATQGWVSVTDGDFEAATCARALRVRDHDES